MRLPFCEGGLDLSFCGKDLDVVLELAFVFLCCCLGSSGGVVSLFGLRDGFFVVVGSRLQGELVVGLGVRCKQL